MVDSVWFVLADVKEELEIASGDTADDAYLNTKGTVVNRFIDNLIFPYIDILPVTANLSEALKDLAVSLVSAKFRRKSKEFETASAYQAEADRLIKSIITRLIASKEGRTERVAVTKAYATEPLASDDKL